MAQRTSPLFSNLVPSGEPGGRTALTIVTALTLLLALGLSPQRDVHAQTPPSPAPSSPPDLASLIETDSSAMIPVVHRFAEDQAALRRRYDAVHAPERRNRLRTFYDRWQDRLASINFEQLGVEGRIDYLLLQNEIRSERHKLDRQERRHAEMRSYLPFASTITDLFYDWREDPSIDPRAAADSLAAIQNMIEQARTALSGNEVESSAERVVAYRAASAIEDLQSNLEEWYQFYDGYHPEFTWWAEQPYNNASEDLEAYRTFLRRELVGIEEGEEAPLIGDPIGGEALRQELQYEMIPYTPEELIAIAEKELAWGKRELKTAARDMGHGDDWRAALEEVKTRHVEPGEQPQLASTLADEAVSFLRERDLVTIPPKAEEIWRMEMLSPEWQRIAPYFLGGEVVRVAYPAQEMSHENKLMSIRGNNRHFSRAVVHHELIPGHHLQGFMTDRYNSHRSAFSTPFWGEGWALYWEMLLWDLDFPRSAEDRVGMLFWRNHRAARIIFSLRYHLGDMSAQEAVDFLVEEVGHERANAEAEVRRSIIGTYPPLYQAAYMLGGLQFRALHNELVENGDLSNRTFHDRILKGGRMPVELVRARLRGTLLPRDYTPNWRFYAPPTNE